MNLELTGITFPPGNRCHIEGCNNDACTALWQDNIQFNICGWHLKELIDPFLDIDEKMSE
jgi:hypothetical protein